MNASQITNYLNPGVWGSSFDARTFGELSLNLPDAMPSVGEDPCFNYVRMHTHTRASEAIDSQLIDSLVPIPVRVQSCSAQGTTFDDANGNGEHENGEPGLEGVEVFVDYDDDEKPDPDEPVGVSDEEGEWGVAPVETPGTFDVILDPPGNVQCSDPNACEEERTFPADGSNEVGVTFTAFETATASGELFEDSNGDGDEDPGEEGLDGWTVFADDDKDGAADQDEPSDTTDERGDYEISDITPGSYTIRPELPQTWECTRPGQCKYDEKVSSGDELTGLDFAVSKKGKGPSDGGDDGGGADGGGGGGGGGPTGGGGVSGGDAGTAGSLPLTGLGLGLLGLTGLLLLGCGLGAGRMLTRR